VHVVYNLDIFDTRTIMTCKLFNETSFGLLVIEMVEEIRSLQSVFLVLIVASFH